MHPEFKKYLEQSAYLYKNAPTHTPSTADQKRRFMARKAHEFTCPQCGAAENANCVEITKARNKAGYRKRTISRWYPHESRLTKAHLIYGD
jgi:predicted RNA-binding Zn-ribbon protein involved in translation (DUF1610 family)